MTLLSTDHPTYLRRLAREINAARYGRPMYVQPEGWDRRRVVRARVVRGRLQVGTMGSDVWFGVTAEQVEGVCASREVR